MRDTKSPIENEQLVRTPGRSLSQMLEERLEQTMFWWIGASFGVALSLTEWVFYFSNAPRNPWIVTTPSALLFVYALYRLYTFPSQVDPIKQGRDGEQWVGNLLEGMRAKGYVPVHDIPCTADNGKEFNIDHVIVGPKGVFVVETKTWSKERNEINEIDYRDGQLLKSGVRIGNASLLQAQRNTVWIRQLLEKRLGRTITTTPVLTLPKWKVLSSATAAVKNEHGVYILSTKAILTYFDGLPKVLSVADIHSISTSLLSYSYEYAQKNLEN